MLQRSLIILFFLFFVSVPGWSQRQGRGSMPDTEEVVERLAAKLDLDPLQEYSFKEIVTNTINQRRELINAGLDQAEIRDSVRSINEEEMKALGKVLDEDQLSAYKEMKDQMRQRARNRGKKRNRDEG